MKIMKEWYVKNKLKNELLKTFKLGGIYKEVTTPKGKQYKRYPFINEINIDYDTNIIEFVFDLKYGINPDVVFKQKWLFKQTLGEVIELNTYNDKHILLKIKGY